MNTEERSDYNKKYYQKKKQILKDRARIRNEEYKNFFRELKESKPCTDCNKFFPSYVMDYDHIIGEKKTDIARMIQRGYRIQTILEEIEKCQLVCANCHRIRTYGRAIRLVTEPVLKTVEANALGSSTLPPSAQV